MIVGLVAVAWAGVAIAGDASDVNDPCQANQVVTIWPQGGGVEVVPTPVYANAGNVVRFQNLTEKEIEISFIQADGTKDSPFESAILFVVPARSAVCETVKAADKVGFTKDAKGVLEDRSFDYTVTMDQVTARPRIVVKPSSD